MGTPAPAMGVLLPGMAVLLPGLRSCSPGVDSAPPTGTPLPGMGMPLLGLPRCSPRGARLPQEGKLLLGLGRLQPPLARFCLCGGGRWARGWRVRGQLVASGRCHGAEGAVSGEAGVCRRSPGLGQGRGHGAEPAVAPLGVPGGARDLGAPAACGAPGVPLHRRQPAGSASAAAPSCARSQSPSCRSRGASPGGRSEPARGRAWVRGPSARLLGGAAPALGGFTPSEELCGEERGQLCRGLGCQLPAPSPSWHPPRHPPALLATGYLPSLPAACPYKGTGTDPTAGLPRLRSSLAPGPTTLRPPRATAATQPCRGHPATPPSAAPVGTARLLQPEGTATLGTFTPTEGWRAAEQAGDREDAPLLRTRSRGVGTRHLCQDGNRLSGQAVGVTVTHSPPNVPRWS